MGCTASSSSGIKDSKAVVPLAPTKNEIIVDEKVSEFENLPQFSSFLWNSLFVTAKTPEEAIIGHGSFGTVIRAIYRPNDDSGNIKDIDVAVKVMTKALAGVSSDEDFELLCDKAIKEVELIQIAARRMVFSDCIVTAYGVCRGALPESLNDLFQLPPGELSVGIVMRYEGGGSLENLLSLSRHTRTVISMMEKLRLLCDIARGLAELHAVGLVHSDIKPENVLLSTHKPPKIRLADFGLAILTSTDANISASSLSDTKHLRGTPVYCAPELLVNPYEEFTGSVAKSSRKTDMYAFAMLAWEMLTQQKPFAEISNESVLCSRVHKGFRPSLEILPTDTPAAVVTMITSCWDKDRSRRQSAPQAFALLSYQQSQVIGGAQYDIVLCHHHGSRVFLDHLAHHLAQFGLRVWYNQGSTGEDTSSALRSILTQSSCKAILCALNDDYVKSDSCLQELRQVKKIAPTKKIIPLLLQGGDPSSWVTDEVIEFCNIKTGAVVDCSSMAADSSEWIADEGPSDELLSGLHKSSQPLIRILIDSGCNITLPSSSRF